MKLRKIQGVSVIAVLLCLTGCTNKKVTDEAKQEWKENERK
ncbi:hypothetical protein NE634_10605 [Lacrimispora saccharolytica]|nr:hypothetical protein [Lacrimispora saccharolytica]